MKSDTVWGTLRVRACHRMGPLLVLSMFFCLTDSVEIINATRGAYVHLPCKPPTFHEVEAIDVKWRKQGLKKTFCEYSLNLTVRTLRHCAFSVKPSSEGLNILYLKNTLSGSYSCFITRTIPPPTLELYNTTIELKADGVGLELEQVNTTDPGCVQLLCTIGITGQDQVGFIWTVRGRNISKEGLISDSSFTASSSLHLCGTDWSSGDIITCSTAQPSGLTSKWTIDGQNSFDQNTGKGGSSWLVTVICTGAVTGTVLIIAIAVIIYKCKKSPDDASIVYTNKVYENFSFGTGIPNRQSTAETTATQHEHCVYEN